ncbi:MAG: ClpX C4-type zinc finger protein [Treponema sp.]|jgi:hypothetical protein|nr:ClpX C4-type zinc finger protein [Treponema sp.]
MAKKKPENPAARPSGCEEPPESIRRCSFCGISPNDACFLIAGLNNVFICENCVELGVRVLTEARKDFR